MREFSPFNQILLSLFDVLSAFHPFMIVFKLTLKQKCVKQYK